MKSRRVICAKSGCLDSGTFGRPNWHVFPQHYLQNIGVQLVQETWENKGGMIVQEAQKACPAWAHDHAPFPTLSQMRGHDRIRVWNTIMSQDGHLPRRFVQGNGSKNLAQKNQIVNSNINHGKPKTSKEQKKKERKDHLKLPNKTKVMPVTYQSWGVKWRSNVSKLGKEQEKTREN